MFFTCRRSDEVDMATVGPSSCAGIWGAVVKKNNNKKHLDVFMLIQLNNKEYKVYGSPVQEGSWCIHWRKAWAHLSASVSKRRS